MGDPPAGQDTSPPRRVRVLVVDDHQVFAAALSRALDDEPDLEVVAAVTGAEEALEAAAAADVVLCDYRLDRVDGVELTRRLRRAHPEVQVVMLTASTDDNVLVAAVEAGCAGFVVKTQPLDDVLAAVRATARGETCITPAQMGRLLPRLTRSERGPGPELTPREREVLARMAEGGTNQAIADELFLSRDTVRNHVANILRKLGAHSKLEAVAVATRRGILRPPVE